MRYASVDEAVKAFCRTIAKRKRERRARPEDRVTTVRRRSERSREEGVTECNLGRCIVNIEQYGAYGRYKRSTTEDWGNRYLRVLDLLGIRRCARRLQDAVQLYVGGLDQLLANIIGHF